MLRRALLAALLLALTSAGPAMARVAPSAALSGPATIKLGAKATFDASSSTHDPAGRIVEYAWDLEGNGRFDDVRKWPKITATMTTPGEVTVSVRVTDDEGETSIAVGHFFVEAPPAAPISPPVDPGDQPAVPGEEPVAAAPLGGSPALGIAPLDAVAQQWIVVGSPRRFAAINGAVRRRVGAVRAHGLWVNLLSDRAARFVLDVFVPRAAARRLGLKGRVVGRQVAVGHVVTRLRKGGQRPHRIVLPRGVRRALRAPLTLLVRGTATDGRGRRAAVSRAFALRR